jgi:hypothetical protein
VRVKDDVDSRPWILNFNLREREREREEIWGWMNFVVMKKDEINIGIIN